jgi:hypothetical protein
MKDFNGVELQIGDTVAMISPYIKGLAKAKVVGFTTKMVQCEWNSPFYKWSKEETKIEVTNRDPKWVTKIAEQL